MITEGKTILIFIGMMAAATLTRRDPVPAFEYKDPKQIIITQRLEQKYSVLRIEQDSIEKQLCQLRALVDADSCKHDLLIKL